MLSLLILGNIGVCISQNHDWSLLFYGDLEALLNNQFSIKMRLMSAHAGGLCTCSREFTRRVIKRNLTKNWY